MRVTESRQVTRFGSLRRSHLDVIMLILRMITIVVRLFKELWSV